MSEAERYISVPPIVEFVEKKSGKRYIAFDEKTGQSIEMPDRTFEWWINTYILTHHIFSMEVGGYDAVKAMGRIKQAVEDVEFPNFFEVTANQLRMLKITMAPPNPQDPPEVQAKTSSRGMTTKMSNMEAAMFVPFMDAIMKADVDKPVLPESESCPETDSAPPTPGPVEAQTQEAVN